MMNRSVSEEPSDRLFIAFRLKKIELRYNPVYNLKIHKMQEHVSHVADGVDVIRDATVQLGKETDEIGKDIKNLSDIAQRNEDTVKGTISFSDEVLGTVNSVTEMSTEVSSSANDMAGVVSHFPYVGSKNINRKRM